MPLGAGDNEEEKSESGMLSPPPPPLNSNVSRPMPRANTGSALLNFISNPLMALLQFERRFDHWLRIPFDATLRDPTARFVTWLINRKRPDEGLRIAEEKLLPGEEEFLDSIIASFETQMRLLWKPGGFERGGNTKTQGIVRGEFVGTTIFPRNSATAFTPSRRPFAPGSGSPARALTSLRTSTTRAS